MTSRVRRLNSGDFEADHALVGQSIEARQMTGRLRGAVPSIFVYERDGEILGRIALNYVPVVDGLVLKNDIDRRFVIARLYRKVEEEIRRDLEPLRELSRQLVGNNIGIQLPTVLMLIPASDRDWLSILEKFGTEPLSNSHVLEIKQLKE